MPAQPARIRNPLADYRKALEDQVALHRSLGEEPTPYLLQQLAELDAREGRFVEKVEPGRFAQSFERKDENPPMEQAVPRRPGRPRKPTDADRAAGR